MKQKCFASAWAPVIKLDMIFNINIACFKTQRVFSVKKKKKCFYFYSSHFRLFGRNGICYSCHETIPPNEMVMKTQDHVYHLRCFSCSRCHFPLSIGDKYRLCEGKIVCCDRECIGLTARKGAMLSRRGGKTARLPNAVKAWFNSLLILDAESSSLSTTFGLK